MPGEGHEDPTEAQIRWQVFQAIAYGAKGLLYFAFHPFGVGLPGGLVRCEPKHAVGPCPNALEPTHHELCRGCRHPITPNDKQSEYFEDGVTCPHCHDILTPAKITAARERQKQMRLAEQKGMHHIGPQAQAK